jgi:hypothetical protein
MGKAGHILHFLRPWNVALCGTGRACMDASGAAAPRPPPEGSFHHPWRVALRGTGRACRNTNGAAAPRPSITPGGSRSAGPDALVWMPTARQSHALHPKGLSLTPGGSRSAGPGALVWTPPARQRHALHPKGLSITPGGSRSAGPVVLAETQTALQRITLHPKALPSTVGVRAPPSGKGSTGHGIRRCCALKHARTRLERSRHPV